MQPPRNISTNGTRSKMHYLCCVQLHQKNWEILKFSKSDDLIAMLCVKFGWKMVFVLGRLLSILPQVISGNTEQRILAGSFPELEKMVTIDELHAVIDLLRKCQDFVDFSYEKSVVAISENAKIPLHRILFSPTTACFTCG